MATKLLRQPSRNNLMYSNRSGEQLAATYVGTQWLWDKQIYDDRSARFDEEIGSYIQEEYHTLISGMSSEGISMSTARTNAVEDKWEIYHFFAQVDIGAPQEVFTYVNDKGEVVPFTDQDMAKIESWEKGVGAAVEGIEGHHIHPVSYHPDDIALAADPNNIVFATESAHLDHLHGGNYANYTVDQYLDHDQIFTHEEMLDITLDHRHQLYMTDTPIYQDVGAMTYMGVSTLAAVSVFTVVKAGFELYRLRGSNFSNHLKRQVVLRQAGSNFAVGSMIATSAVGAKMGYDAIFHDVSIELLGAELLLGSLDIVVGFGVAQMAAGLLRYRAERNKGVSEALAKQNLQAYLNQTMVEVAAFSGVGLAAMGASELLQSLGEDMLSSMIDPTGITAAAILTYKGFKFGKGLFDQQKNKAAFERSSQIRTQHMVETARRENQLLLE